LPSTRSSSALTACAPPRRRPLDGPNGPRLRSDLRPPVASFVGCSRRLSVKTSRPSSDASIYPSSAAPQFFRLSFSQFNCRCHSYKGGIPLFVLRARPHVQSLATRQSTRYAVAGIRTHCSVRAVVSAWPFRQQAHNARIDLTTDPQERRKA
jgi:hypothetical protein